MRRVLQPGEWSKPRGFTHGVVVDGPGELIVLAGQTGSDENGDYSDNLAEQAAIALQKIVRLLEEAGAGPEHIVRLTWYITDRSEYDAIGPRLAAAWRETFGKNFPPSTLLFVSGLIDVGAKIELEVTAFVSPN